MSLEDISNNYDSDIDNNQDIEGQEIEQQEIEQQEIEEQDININENNGLIEDDNELSNIDFENIGMIPCEICQTMISFDDYSSHLTHCIRNYNLRRERFNILNGFLNILNASDNLIDGQNINNNLIPRDDENINDTDETQEYNDENEINEENTGSVNIEEVNNIEVNSEDVDVVNTDNAVNENNDEVVEPYDQFIRNFTPLHRTPNTARTVNIPLILPNVDNIYWSNNIERRLINNLEINIGNLHNLTYENNNTEYDFNLLIQRLMGGDVKIGVKDFNKIIIPLSDEELNDNDICNICLDNLKDVLKSDTNNGVKINLPVKTTCGHLYCRNCIYKWLSQNKTCPVCKHEFENDENEHIEDNDMEYNNIENTYIEDDDTNNSDNSDDEHDSLPELVSDTDTNSDYDIQVIN